MQRISLLLAVLFVFACSEEPSHIAQPPTELSQTQPVETQPVAAQPPQTAPSVINPSTVVEPPGPKYRQATAAETLQSNAEFGLWPSLRGPHRDGISREVGIARQWSSDGPKVLWEKELGGGYASFSVASDRLYTMSRDGLDEIVHCWHARSGEKLWEHRYPAQYDAFPALDPLYYSGPRVTPVVEKDLVFALGTTGVLHCLNAENGSVIWTKNLFDLSGLKDMPKFGYSNSPLIVGNRVFVEPGGTDNRSLAALDKNTGDVIWIGGKFRYGYSSPILATVQGIDQVIYFTGEGPVGVAPETGEVFWTYPWETTLDINVATPIYHDGKLFVSSAYGVGAAVLKLQAKAPPALLWKNKSIANYFSSSILFEGHLYAFSMSRLRCVSWETGKILWDTPGLGRGSLLIADRMLIALSEAGELVLADARPDRYRELARWKAVHGTVWNIPVLAGGILYLRDEKHVIAVEAR